MRAYKLDAKWSVDRSVFSVLPHKLSGITDILCSFRHAHADSRRKVYSDTIRVLVIARVAGKVFVDSRIMLNEDEVVEGIKQLNGHEAFGKQAGVQTYSQTIFTLSHFSLLLAILVLCVVTAGGRKVEVVKMAMEQLSFAEQLAQVVDCDLLVGMHGA